VAVDACLDQSGQEGAIIALIDAVSRRRRR
jgi:hypothetical protein